MKCCFFGHRNLIINIKDELYKILEGLVQNRGVKIFYTGDMWESDNCFYSVVRSLKYKYPDISIILVKYCFTNELNNNRNYYTQAYDSIIIPDELAEKHYKSLIALKNKWVVDNSDIVVSGVFRDFGGAYQAIKYAKSHGKEIIEVIKKSTHCG